MLRLENWGDMFKWNKEILDDDFNAGQFLIAKGKKKTADGEWVPLFNLNLSGSSSHLQAGSTSQGRAEQACN